MTYEITYANYKDEPATVTIEDKLDENVAFVSADKDGDYDETAHKVTWTLEKVPAGESGVVTLTVSVLEGALKSNGGSGKVANGGEGTWVQIGNDTNYTVDIIENPVPEEPEKKEIAPYEGTGALGAVKVDDVITYTVSYENYKAEAADIVIKDTLDENVAFVSADKDGVYDEATHKVTWTLEKVPAGESGVVTLKVKVLETALVSNGGNGVVANGGDGTSVKVGNDAEYNVNNVTNPVPEEPEKKEIKPYTNENLGGLKVGDEVTYEITYANYKDEPATVTIKDKLDVNVAFVSATQGGTHTGEKAGGLVTWTLEAVPAGESGTVQLTVKVLEGALKTLGGPGKVANGGEYTTVQVGNDSEYTVNTVENEVLVTEVSVTKIWDDEDNNDDYRPTAAEYAESVHLLADGEEVDIVAPMTKTVTNGRQNTYIVKYENLPKTNEDGTEIVYTVKEDEIEHYTAKDGIVEAANGETITNTHKIDETEAEVLKIWDDNDNQDGLRPEAVTMVLTKNNVATETKVELNEDNDWTGKVEHLPKYEDGDEIVYGFIEEAVDNYSMSGLVINGTLTTITNSYTPDRFCLSVLKVWDDANDQDGLRPDTIEVELLANGNRAVKADGEEVANLILDEANHWTGLVTGLPIYSDGEAIVYEWVELSVPEGYEVTYEAVADNERITTIINKHEPDETSISVKKVWDDSDDQDGIRAEAVTVELLADGVPTAEAILNAANSWSYTFEALAKLDKGEEIEYTVREIDAPDGYTFAVSGDAETGYTVTNTHAPEQVKLGVLKVWDDADDQDGKRPEALTVALSNGEEEILTVTLSEQNSWYAETDLLPKYADGEEIEYTWTESRLPEGYTLTATSTETDGEVTFTTLTNTHVPEETVTTVIKAWDDADDKFGKRPESITMTLKADGEAIGYAVLSEENDWTETRAGLPKYKNGQKIVYSWTEDTVPAGYEMTQKTVETDETTGASVTTFTNTYLLGSLKITKTFEFNGGEDLPDDVTEDALNALSFTITGPDEFEQTVTYADFEDGVYALSDLQPGKYTVVETNAVTLITDYTLDALNSTMSGSALVLPDSEDGEPIEISLINKYTEDLGKLIIQKAFCGVPKTDTPWDEEALKKLTFTVTGPNGYSKTFTYDDLTESFEDEGGNLIRMLTIENLKPGEYTVTEANADKIITGYTLNTETSVMSGSANVVKDAEVTVVLKNNYKKDQGALTLEKTFDITGADGEPVDPETLSNQLAALAFTVTGADLVNDETYEETFYYAQFKDGKLTIEGLTPGSYTVTETNADGLIAGYTLVADESTTATEPIPVSANETATATLKNVYKETVGELVITKTVRFAEGSAAADLTGKTFTFTVKNADGKYITADGAVSDEKVELTIAAGGEVTIGHLPIGRYTVTELLNSAEITNYTLVTTGDGASVTEGEAQVAANETVTVDIVNVYEEDKGEIKVTKKVVGMPVGITDKTFKIAVVTVEGEGDKSVTTFYNTDGSVAEGEAWVTFSDGDTVTWTGLPVGTYQVIEDQEDAAIDIAPLTVAGDGEVQVFGNATSATTVVNNYSGEVGSLLLTKQFAYASIEGVVDPEDVQPEDLWELSFLIQGEYFEQTVYYLQFEDGQYLLENLPVGEYTITEMNGDEALNAYVLNIDQSVVDAEAELTEGAETDVMLINNYVPFVGSIEVTKSFLFDGSPVIPEDVDESKLNQLTFVVKNSRGITVDTFTYEDIVKSGGVYTIKNLAVGVYTITEINAGTLIANYVLSGSSPTMLEAMVLKPAKDEEFKPERVAFTNEYSQNLGNLKIHKIFAGVADDVDVDALEFSITGPEGFEPVTVTYGEFDDHGEYTLSGIPVGTYHITETNAETAVTDYTLRSESITQMTTDVVGLATVTVNLFNFYEQDLGSLVIHKTFSGVPEGADVSGLIFRVIGPKGFVMSVSYADFTDGVYTLENLPVGHYTVVEINALNLIEGYSLVQTASVTTGETEVSVNAEAQVALTNVYDEDVGSLVITKTFIGIGPDDDVSCLLINVIGPNGFDEIISYADFTNGTYTFTDIPVGQYVVYEMNADGLSATLSLSANSVTAVAATIAADAQTTVSLINQYNTVDTGVAVAKVWNDMDNLDGSRPERLTVHLSNGTTTVATVVLSAANNWMAEITDLPLFDGDKLIKYTWREEEVLGYELTNVTVAGNATVFVNTHVPELTSASVIKVWDDKNNEANLRPATLRVTLSNGTSYILSAANNWTVTVRDLPVYVNGEKQTYTWSEQTVLGYTQTSSVTVDGVTVFTNSYRIPQPPGHKPPTDITIVDNPTPLGIDILINHVGDCFD